MDKSLLWIACAHDRDSEDALGLRMTTRPAHLEYIASLGERIALAGPILDADGSTPRGSLLGYKVATQSEAEAILAADPYTHAGLWGDVRWINTRIVAGDLATVLAD